jgi:hypothetical protein
MTDSTRPRRNHHDRVRRPHPAETAEQLTGFYIVESEDLDDLLQVVGYLADGEGALEVRACVDHSGS